MDNYLGNGQKPPGAKFPHGDVIIPMTLVDASNVGKIAAWGTPQEIAPLSYGASKAFTVTSSK
jgi:hypothetical protein